MMSSGMSSQVSSGGVSGVTSMDAAGSADEEGAAAGSSGFFSGLFGGLLGGGAEDIVRGDIKCLERLTRSKRTRVPEDQTQTILSLNCFCQDGLSVTAACALLGSQLPRLPFSIMADQPAIPSQDDRARYEALKKELMQALPKKRVIDRQLVRAPVP